MDPVPAVRILSRKVARLPVKLTVEQRIDKARELTDTLEAIVNQSSHEAMVKQSLKSDMASLESKRDELRVIVSRGEVLQEVDVEEQADDKAAKILRVRMDTGEVIFERAQTADERQTSMSLIEDDPAQGPPVI